MIQREWLNISDQWPAQTELGSESTGTVGIEENMMGHFKVVVISKHRTLDMDQSICNLFIIFSTSTSGSFVREQNLDFGKELYDEIVNKYADNSIAENDQQIEKKSGKEDGIHWELVKMDKIHKKQKEIFKLRCIVLR